MHVARYLIAGLTVWAAVASTGGMAATQGVVSAIAVRDIGGLTQITVDLSRRAEYRALFLNEPMRLVVDFPALDFRLNDVTHSPRGVIAGYRYGQFDGETSRLVFDLSAPARIRKVGYTLPSAKKAQQLILELERTSPIEFQAAIQPWAPSGSDLKQAAGESARASDSPQLAAAPGSRIAVLPKPTPAAVPLPPRPEPTKPSERRSGDKRVIVIDPGHGGVDPGAIGARGTMEKNVTLGISREVKRQLEATGRYRVHLTRDSDVFIRLRDRVAKARAVNADLFVSIHADSIGNRHTSGASIYTLSETASDSEAAALAQRENRADIIAGVDLSHETPEVATILIDLAQRETNNQSAILAGVLVQELAHDVPLLPAKPHRFAGFAVLKAPDIPSILVELGYLSNPAEERLLNRQQHRMKVAAGVVRSLDKYFAKHSARR